MRAEDLYGQELVELSLDDGLIRFVGERMILVDATAIGTLRARLIEQIGQTATRAVLTRFGYIQGWRLAEAVQSKFDWESPDEWVEAGSRGHMLQGMYFAERTESSPLSKAGMTVTGSFEAEQHVAHLGRSETPTCWMLCGVMSGYLSRASDREIFVLEERCVGRGDAACHFLGRTRAEWGDRRADELRFFHRADFKEMLDSSLHEITNTLKSVERKLHARRRALARVVPGRTEPAGMVARSAAMRHVLDLAKRVAKVDTTLLITGESGTGKERIAQFVHEESARARGPFVAVNCSAISESLLESELFGHARGSFTGAKQDRAGLFESANGGTLLLDEVGEMTLGLQVKLLRVLQEHEIRRVGENHNRSVNARIIAATNQSLPERIEAGLFRKDLFYRLNVVELRVPPLRDRREDIVPLANVLLTESALRMKRPTAALSPEAADQLLRYAWPGNVRELENAMERAVALATVPRIELKDLPEEVRQAVPSPSLVAPIRALEAVEKEYILAVLHRNEGNRTETAEQLGIGTATLYRKLKAYGLVRSRRVTEEDGSAGR